MPALSRALACFVALAAACAPAQPQHWPTLALEPSDASPVFTRLRGPAGPERFSQVDERLYRGGQPTNAQLDDLKALGVTTIVSLRDEYPTITRAERAHAEAIGLRFVHVPFSALYAVKPAVILRVLGTLRDPTSGKVYIHCHIGRDRTSLMVALHLVMNRGWVPKVAWQRAALDYGHQPTYWFRALSSAFKRTTMGADLSLHAAGPLELELARPAPAAVDALAQ